MAVRNKLAELQAKSKDFSLTRISKETGISVNTLCAIKYGKEKGLRYDTIDALCGYFNIGVEELLERVDDAC